MIDYFTVFTNTNGVAFPDTEAVNATSPSATDGTEFVKLMVDDEWGARQAIMNYASLIPDGVTEADGTAQIIEALQKGFSNAPGIVTEWNLASDPATTGHRALLMQGQGILHANFVDLTNAVYVGDGNNAAVAAGGGAYFKSTTSDGLNPNIAGTFLILPESRGVVARGLDVAASIDPDGASRFLGDLQIDASQGHWHNIGTDAGVAASVPASGTGGLASTGSVEAPADKLQITKAIAMVTDLVNGTPRISSETRMYNRSTKHVLWY